MAGGGSKNVQICITLFINDPTNFFLNSNFVCIFRMVTKYLSAQLDLGTGKVRIDLTAFLVFIFLYSSISSFSLISVF